MTLSFSFFLPRCTYIGGYSSMCAVFCGESAPLEQYYCNYTFPVLSFLPPAHVHTMILQNMCSFFVRSRPFWSSTTIVKPVQSCLSFCWCQYNYNYPFLVLPFLPPAHTPSLAGMVHRTCTQIKWILSLIQACYCTNPPSLIREDVDEAVCIKFK